MLLLPQSSPVSSFLVSQGWSTHITPSQSDIFARPFSFATSHGSDIPSCFFLCCPQDTLRALPASWFSQPGSEPKQGTDPAEKNSDFFFFFPVFFFSWISSLARFSEWPRKHLHRQSVCVGGDEMRLWIQGEEVQTPGLSAESTKTKLVHSLLYSHGWLSHEYLKTLKGLKFILKPWAQKDSAYNERTHICTPTLTHSVIFCFHWNNTVQNDEYFLILAAFLQVGKNWLVQ